MKQHITEFLNAHSAIVRIDISAAKGSTPREQGAFMLVASEASFGTIGGGRLELDAISKAKMMLETGEARSELDVALGPEINQCCGGRVELQLTKLNDIERSIMNEAVIQNTGR